MLQTTGLVPPLIYRACALSAPFRRLGFLIFLVFFEPCHLDGFQLALGGRHRIILEVGQLGDPFMQVGETDIGWINIRMQFIKAQRDVVRVVPGESRHDIPGFIVDGPFARRNTNDTVIVQSP